ncbi:MAG: hypothetical protein WCI46_09275 [Verrucomicrobiota bacterium]
MINSLAALSPVAASVLTSARSPNISTHPKLRHIAAPVTRK